MKALHACLLLLGAASICAAPQSKRTHFRVTATTELVEFAISGRKTAFGCTFVIGATTPHADPPRPLHYAQVIEIIATRQTVRNGVPVAVLDMMVKLSRHEAHEFAKALRLGRPLVVVGWGPIVEKNLREHKRIERPHRTAPPSASEEKAQSKI